MLIKWHNEKGMGPCTRHINSLIIMYCIAGKFGGNADWPQSVRIKILADFNLADGRVQSSYAPNLPHAHARLRLLRGVACYIIEQTVWSAMNEGIIVFGLQPSVRDYPAILH